jgi:hypothetical protein
MEVVHGHLLGPVTITRDTILHGTVTGDVTVPGGVHLDLLGTVLGNLLVEDSGTACVRGVVAEAVINRGGVVEIYGSVGRPRPGPSDPQLRDAANASLKTVFQ